MLLCRKWTRGRGKASGALAFWAFLDAFMKADPGEINGCSHLGLRVQLAHWGSPALAPERNQEEKVSHKMSMITAWS